MKKTLLIIIATVICTLLLGFAGLYWYGKKALHANGELAQMNAQYHARLAAKDYKGAEQVLLDALATPGADAPYMQFETHYQLGRVYYELKDDDRREQHYKTAVAVDLSKIGDVRNLRVMGQMLWKKASMLNDLGVLAHSHGHYEEAVADYKEALDLAQLLKDSGLVTEIYENLGNAYTLMNDYERAEYYMQEARKRIEQEVPIDLYSKALIYNNLADMYRQSGRYDEALPLGLQSIGIIDLTNNEVYKGFIYDTVANIYFEKKDYAKAVSYIEKALKFKETGSPYDRANSYKVQGLIFLGINRTAEACASFTTAAGFYQQVQNEKELQFVQEKLKAAACAAVIETPKVKATP